MKRKNLSAIVLFLEILAIFFLHASKSASPEVEQKQGIVEKKPVNDVKENESTIFFTSLKQ